MNAPRVLPAELSIYTVGEVRAQCLAWIGEAAPDHGAHDAAWPLDAHTVDQIDAAGVQLLVSLARSLAPQGLALQLLNPSRVLAEACAALGLGDLLATRTHPGAAA